MKEKDGVNDRWYQSHMGDGSDTLYFRNPADFSIIKKISVTFDGRRIEKINELEWIDGMIYANVWYSDAILVIEPEMVEWLSGLSCQGYNSCSIQSTVTLIHSMVLLTIKAKIKYTSLEKTGPTSLK